LISIGSSYNMQKCFILRSNSNCFFPRPAYISIKTEIEPFPLLSTSSVVEHKIGQKIRKLKFSETGKSIYLFRYYFLIRIQVSDEMCHKHNYEKTKV
jgi:hypothetical protein